MSNGQDDFVVTPSSAHGVSRNPTATGGRPRPQSQSAAQMSDQKGKTDPTLPQAIKATDEKIQAFQLREQKEIIASTVFSTAVSAALRREYLDIESNICVQPNRLSNFESSPIQWLRLSEVGLQSGFTPAKAAEALENVFSAFHIPDRMRLLFLVSSDTSPAGDRVSVRIGLQSPGQFQFGASIPNFISGFSKSNWPGLSFEAEAADSVDFDFSTKAGDRHRGVRILTGIPSGRSKENVNATIDKLAEALSGHSWRYLVVAEPVSAHEMEDTIRICREIAGRAESMKSFQLSESIGKTLGEVLTHTVGESTSTSSRKWGTIGMAGAIGVGVLAVACPALLPAFLPAIAANAAVAKPILDVARGAMPLVGLLGGAMLAGGATETQGKNISDAVAKSLSESENFSFSRTVVNKHAEGAVKLIESQIERFQLCEGIGAWETGVYFVGEDETTAEIGANVLKSLISGDNSHQEPVRIFNPRGCSPEASPLIAFRNFDNPYVLPVNSGEIITHPFGKRFERLRTVVNTRELARLINFPLSNIPGVPVKRIAVDTGFMPQDYSKPDAERIPLGKQIYRGSVLQGCPYTLSTSTLAKHTLVCGINGSGKTNTVWGILGNLLAAEKPFLVIEPAKQEYVDWATKRNRELAKAQYSGDVNAASKDPRWINVYIPGREKWNGEQLAALSINPFDFVWLNKDEPPKTLEHIDRLKTIINAALPMQESLPILMEELIYAVYGVPFSASKPGEKAICWLPSNSQYRTPNFDERIPVPTFVQMANHLPRLFERLSYAKDVQRNLQAALKTRIESFKRGWRRPLLNKELPRHSAEDWERLFGHPTVINLTSLTSDEDKAFFMAVILMFIYEYRQEVAELPETLAENTDGKARGLRHLLVIEEAHRVLGRSEGAVSAFAAAPKQKVSEMFSNMISEVRAYGQGILIADQIPSRLNEDAVKNTNLKIVHKLVSADDRKAMATALNLWDDQERVIGDLNVGEALVRGDMDKEAYMVKVDKNS